MRAWLEPRREDPEPFEQGVGLWGQELGYEDSLICSWMSQLAHEESGGEPSTISVDVLSGEFTEEVTRLNFLNNHIKHVIGSKQTARCQAEEGDAPLNHLLLEANGEQS